MLAVGLLSRLADRVGDRLDCVSLCAPGDGKHCRPDRARIMTQMMLSALDLARRIEAGDLTSRAVVETCSKAIAAGEKEIGAFVALDIAGARRAADDARLAALPLRGLPVAFKDIFATADLPTQYGSPVYAGHRPAAAALPLVAW